jgi:hypothetical protein
MIRRYNLERIGYLVNEFLQFVFNRGDLLAGQAAIV